MHLPRQVLGTEIRSRVEVLGDLVLVGQRRVAATKLEGAEIDFQTQLQANGEKSEKLAQATDAYQFATRESGYRRELIGLRDENYQISIQQEQNLFNEKAARYRAQLAAGQ